MVKVKVREDMYKSTDHMQARRAGGSSSSLAVASKAGGRLGGFFRGSFAFPCRLGGSEARLDDIHVPEQ